MKIKICGMRLPVNIKEVALLQPNYMGLIFYRSSKRYVKDLDPEILKELPASIKLTGVFVNVEFDEITRIIEKYGLKAVQLHGEETADLCQKLRYHGVEVIKAFGVDEHFDFKTLDKYDGKVDHYLFDTKTALFGGSGMQFDWKLLDRYPYKTTFFLSGGIGPDQIKELKNIKDDRLYAIDLNSKFELEPGVKDTCKVNQAINDVRLIDTQ